MKVTLEEYLSELSDEKLIEVQSELLCGVVPKDGSARHMVREINRSIDRGLMTINMYTYRKVYLPSLSKAVDRELARRYVESLVKGVQMEFERTK